MRSDESLKSLLELLNLKTKSEINKYCRNLVVRSEDLSSLILTGRVAGLAPYHYACHFMEAAPKHLPPGAEEL